MEQKDLDRLANIAGHIGGTVEVQSAKAISVIDGMLKAEGLTWAEVMTAGVKACEEAKAPTSMASAFGFGDIFADMMQGFPKPPQAEKPVPTAPRKEFLTGKQIPSGLIGKVRIDDERGFRDGTMLVVTLIDGHIHYGPLAVFDAQGVAIIKSLGEDDMIAGQVRQPTQERHSPTLRLISKISCA